MKVVNLHLIQRSYVAIAVEFFFDSDFVRQTYRVAMGTNMAPSLATLVVGFLEETKLYPQIEEALRVTVLTYLKDNYKRFLDDFCLLAKCA